MTNELRQNLEAMESEELLDRVYKGYLTEEANQIVIEILNTRKIEIGNLPQKLEVSELEKRLSSSELKTFWKRLSFASFIVALNVLLVAVMLNSAVMALVGLVLKIDISPTLKFWTFFLMIFPSKFIINDTLKNRTLKQIKLIANVSFALLILVAIFVYGS